MLPALCNARPSWFGFEHLLHTGIVAPWRRNDFRQLLAVDDQLNLVCIEHFAFQQSQSDPHQRVTVRPQYALGGLISLADQALDLVVDFDRGSFAVVAMLIDLAAKEYLLFLFAEGQRAQVAHAE